MIDATKAERVLVEANPILSTFESIQANIACATHGLLIGGGWPTLDQPMNCGWESMHLPAAAPM
jgi:hypothetical protein